MSGGASEAGAELTGTRLHPGGRAGGLTKFVGREREMDAVMHAAEQARPEAGRSLPRWPSQGQQVTAFVRVQGDFASGRDGAGDVFGLAREGIGLSAVIDFADRTSVSRARMMRANGARRSQVRW